MALQSQQIVNLAIQISKVKGYTSQAGQFLNAILSDLCQTYDLDTARGQFSFTMNPGLLTTSLYPNVAVGGGPYVMPADFLRMASDKQTQWFLNGVPYPMIPCDLDEFDNFVQQAGNQAYPYIFATDMSTAPPNGAGANLLVWPPPSGAYAASIRYRRQMPDILTPESSIVVPWFPNQDYLITRLAGELMKITDDERKDAFLGDGPAGAQGILRRYLILKDDQSDRGQYVKMDRRQFRSAWSKLPSTKTIGW